MRLSAHIFVISLLVSQLFLLSACTSSPVSKHYSELAASDIPYIVMIRKTRAETLRVIYNTEYCEQIGKACGFFRSHGHGLIVLLNPALPPPKYPESSILAADCWAAQYAEADEVAAAIELFSNEALYADLPIVGDPATRAKNIKSCAENSGNLISSSS